MSDAMIKSIMRPPEAAEFLGFSIQYLYKLVEARKITAYKPTGRYLYFKQKDLEDFIERGKVSANYELREKADTILNGGKS
ncbi:MAG: helix-turn-helix domain-containing protein [Treponema sp.]|jgi:excisionase family DNA binding protein|nr:helix-turn-helix domain-containing protein [Treponema sp.]